MKKGISIILFSLFILFNINTIFAEELYGVISRLNTSSSNPSFIIDERHYQKLLDNINSNSELENYIGIFTLNNKLIICPKEGVWKINGNYYLFENFMFCNASNSTKYSISEDGRLISNNRRGSSNASSSSNFKMQSTVTGSNQNVLSDIITKLGKSFAEFPYERTDKKFQFTFDNLSWSARPDCSGFAATIAAIYGSKKGTYNYTDGIITDGVTNNFSTNTTPSGNLSNCLYKISVPTSINDLQMGDVLILGYGTTGVHAIVFYKIQNGHAVFYHKSNDNNTGYNAYPLNIPLNNISSSGGKITFSPSILSKFNVQSDRKVIDAYRLK